MESNLGTSPPPFMDFIDAELPRALKVRLPLRQQSVDSTAFDRLLSATIRQGSRLA